MYTILPVLLMNDESGSNYDKIRHQFLRDVIFSTPIHVFSITIVLLTLLSCYNHCKVPRSPCTKAYNRWNRACLITVGWNNWFHEFKTKTYVKNLMNFSYQESHFYMSVKHNLSPWIITNSEWRTQSSIWENIFYSLTFISSSLWYSLYIWRY